MASSFLIASSADYITAFLMRAHPKSKLSGIALVIILST
jgi:hypothetical protein